MEIFHFVLGILLVSACVESFHVGLAPKGCLSDTVKMSCGGSYDKKMDRRSSLLSLANFGSLSFLLAHSCPVYAKRARGGTEMLKNSTIETREEREVRIKKERAEIEERRKQAEEKGKELSAGKEQVEAELGSNLRGDYYFPTARKRYLPRIRKADEALSTVIANLNGDTPDWGKVSAFLKGPGDVSSALKLYVSALGGGGLSISSKFMDNMRKASADYERAYDALKQAGEFQDAAQAAASARSLKDALQGYREAGRPVGLTNDDWGVGELPDCRNEVGGGVGKMSKCAVGSSFGNANPNLYKRNVKAVEEKAAILTP